MDYLKIILDGYLNHNTQNYLKDYFIREFNKAANEGFGVDEFFNGCLRIIEKFENKVEKEFYKEKKELQDLLNDVKNDNLPKDFPTTTVDEIREQIEELDINSFTIHLLSATNGRYKGNIEYLELNNIAFEIQMAKLDFLAKNLLNKNLPQQYKDYSKVFKSEYHTDIAPEKLQKIIENKYLPEVERVNWHKSKAEIIRIMLYLWDSTNEQLKPDMLKNCFILENGKKFDSNDIPTVKPFLPNKNPFKQN